MSENIEVYSVARKAITGAFDGWGGIHYEAITTTMDMLGIDDPEKRREYFFMVVYFLKAYLGAKQESETGGAIGSVSGKQKTTIGK